MAMASHVQLIRDMARAHEFLCHALACAQALGQDETDLAYPAELATRKALNKLSRLCNLSVTQCLRDGPTDPE
jgi:hypothetical protein